MLRAQTPPRPIEHAQAARGAMIAYAILQRTRFAAPRGFGLRAFPNPPSMDPTAPRWWHAYLGQGPDRRIRPGVPKAQMLPQAVRLSWAVQERRRKASVRSLAWTGARG